MQRWIEIGTPDAARVHKASKAVPQVAVYPHRDVDAWLGKLREGKVHRAHTLEIYVLDRKLVSTLAAKLERRMELDVSISERHLYVTAGAETLSAVIEQRSM